jgi:hypothetical protein
MNPSRGEETPVAIILCAGKKREAIEYLSVSGASTGPMVLRC